MRVNHTNSSPVQGPETQAPKRTGKAARTEGSDPRKSSEAPSDSASSDISSRAKEMAQAKSAAASAPDVREAKIAELRRRIANKEYNVRPEDVADRMVDEHIRTRGIG